MPARLVAHHLPSCLPLEGADSIPEALWLLTSRQRGPKTSLNPSPLSSFCVQTGVIWLRAQPTGQGESRGASAGSVAAGPPLHTATHSPERRRGNIPNTGLLLVWDLSRSLQTVISQNRGTAELGKVLEGQPSSCPWGRMGKGTLWPERGLISKSNRNALCAHRKTSPDATRLLFLDLL